MTGNFVEIKAPAKINLCLNVGPRRRDGYHPVCSLMEEVSLFDTLRARPLKSGGIRLTGTDIVGEENLIVRAARALEDETGLSFNVEVELIKEIPVAAGLGGGSSDAAAALKLFISMFDLDISNERLTDIALSIGADVPFFLTAGPKLVQGVGEILKDVYTMPEHSIVLVVPEAELQTSEVYRVFDETGGSRREAFELRCSWLESDVLAMHDFESLCGVLHNDLELSAPAICDEIDKVKEELRQVGAGRILMSGSGPAVFGLFPEEDMAASAALKIRRRYQRVWVVKPLIHSFNE